jgi:predicted Zn-dependent peptidase
MKYKHKKLKNGLNVFLMPLQDAESVSYNAYVKVGSRYEDPKQAGIAHFLEHLFFKGSLKYPTAALMAEAVDGMGGKTNAGTGKEYTEYYIQVAKKNFEKAFDLHTDMMLHPLFDAKEIEKEKGVIIEEMRMYRDDYNSVAGENLEKMTWPKSKLGDPIIGTEKTVMGINSDDIIAFRDAWYVPGNMTIGIAGNFNEKKVMAKIMKTWGMLPERKIPKMPRTGTVLKTAVQKNTEFSLEHKAIEQSNVIIGFRTKGHKEKNGPAISVLSSILGGGMSSRLFMQVRDRRGLAYFINAGHDRYIDTGSFVINAGLRTTSVPEGIRAIIEEIMDVMKQGVKPDELMKAKNSIRGRSALSLENPQSKLEYAISRFLVHGDVQTFEQAMAKIDAVTMQQVLKVAREIFNPKSMAVSIVGPISDKAELRNASFLT